MSRASNLLADCLKRGIVLRPVGQDLVWKALVPGAMAPELLARLRDHKLAVWELLTWLRDAADDPREGPAGPSCFNCGSTRLWLSVHGATACGTCYPPAAEELVKTWIDPVKCGHRSKEVTGSTGQSFGDVTEA